MGLRASISSLTQDRDALTTSLDKLRAIETATAQVQALFDAEKFRTSSLQESLSALETENEELTVKAQRLAQVEPSGCFQYKWQYVEVDGNFWSVLQKAGNLLRDEQSRASSLGERVHELEAQVKEIPRQLQTITALEADKSDLFQQLAATQARELTTAAGPRA